MAATSLALATLLCLNGLKSSLTLTGVPFLIGRLPKKGLGAVGTLSAARGLGDTAAEAALGLGETGLKAFAFGFGLNDDALTFKRAADVGEVGGTSVRGVTAEDPELLPLVGVALADARGLFPLKAGMG